MDQHVKELELVQKILNGERENYRVLVDRYAPIVFSVVNRFVNTEDDAEELAQEIFVKTYERLSSFEGGSKFSTWLYMIAMNHCRDYAKNIRRKNSRFSEMDEEVLDKKMQDDFTPEEEVEKKEWVDVLRDGLSSINPNYAKAFLMKYDDNMSYQAMSTRLNVSVSALKVRVYRAKKELKTFMESQGHYYG